MQGQPNQSNNSIQGYSTTTSGILVPHGTTQTTVQETTFTEDMTALKDKAWALLKRLVHGHTTPILIVIMISIFILGGIKVYHDNIQPFLTSDAPNYSEAIKQDSKTILNLTNQLTEQQQEIDSLKKEITALQKEQQ